ncbi:hypothetical protein OSTOST_10140, partial [Ostertagia ostertagi]
ISVRPVNGELYADLVVNGQLDREYRDKYELIVEAIDGGKPANHWGRESEIISVRPVNGELYADLVVNGQLDREYRDKYELIVEAIDGGKPA